MRNQLTAISGAVTASFQYDTFGRRMRKTVNGVATDYLYDGGNVVQEKMGGTPSANLLTGGIDEVFSRANTSATQSLLTDGLGSTVALLDSAGLPQTEYTYEPFGNTGTSGPASANSSQYTGRENDGTGLYYYRARYYSPTLQRFISEDPAEFGGGDSNLYAYVSNSPSNFTDPSGEMNPLVGACLGGAAFSVVDDIFSGRKPTPRSAFEGCLGGLLFFGAGRALGPILKAVAPKLPRLPGVTPRPALAPRYQRHHSDPKFLGGDPKQPLTRVPERTHQKLHRDMNDFLRNRKDSFGNDMAPRRGNSGQRIRQNFSRQERIDALRDFYNQNTNRYPGAARDFFNQHP